MNEYVEDKVKGPAIAMIVFGVLAVVLNLLSAILNLVMYGGTFISLISSGAGADAWISFLTSAGGQILSAVIAFFVAFIVAFAGTRLKSLRSPGIIYAGAIMAAIPCCSSWCCCVGLPIGIWAIITMQDEQVKAAFSE